MGVRQTEFWVLDRDDLVPDQTTKGREKDSQVREGGIIGKININMYVSYFIVLTKILDYRQKMCIRDSTCIVIYPYFFFSSSSSSSSNTTFSFTFSSPSYCPVLFSSSLLLSVKHTSYITETLTPILFTEVRIILYL